MMAYLTSPKQHFTLSSRRRKFSSGGRVNLGNGSEKKNSLLDMIEVQASGSKGGKSPIPFAPEGITSQNEFYNAIIKLDIPVAEKLNILADWHYGKDRTRIEKDNSEIYLDEGSHKNRNVGVGYNQDGEGWSGSAKRNLETGDDEFKVQYKKTFEDGGRVLFSNGSDIVEVDKRGREIKAYSKSKNVKKGFIHPIKFDGEQRWFKEPQGNKGKFDSTMLPPLESEKNNKRYKFDIAKDKWVYQTRNVDGTLSEEYVQKKGESFKDFHERRSNLKSKAISLTTEKLYDTKTKPTLDKINAWTTNWLDKNLKKFNLKDKEKFLKAIEKDYKAFVKKEFGNVTKIGATSLFSPDGLPNVSRSVVPGKMSIFEYDGFKPIDTGKFGGQQDVNLNPTRRKNISPFLEKVFWKNKIETTPGFADDLAEYMKYITTNKTLKVNRGFVLNFKPNEDVKWLLDSSKSGLKDATKRDVLNTVVDESLIEKYNTRLNMGEAWKNNMKTIENALGKDEIKKLLGHNSIEAFMKSEGKEMRKIFDWSKLPKDLKLGYAVDHAQGLALAAKSGDKKFMKLALTDLVGTTNKINTELGRGVKKDGKFFNFSTERNKLVNAIESGDTAKLKELNQITEDAYKKKNVYSIKGGKVVSEKISPAVTKTDRFKNYIETIVKDGTAKKEVIKQLKTSPTLNDMAKEINAIKKYANSKGVTLSSFAGAVDFSQSGIKFPPEIAKSLDKVVKYGGMALRGFGKAAIVLDPMFAAYDASTAFTQGQGKEAKFEMPYELTFADDTLQKKLAAMPKAEKLKNIANLNFDQTTGANLRIEDYMDMPVKKTDIDAMRDEHLKDQLGPYYKELSTDEGWRETGEVETKKPIFGKYVNQIKT